MSKKTPKNPTLETIEAHQCRWPIGDPRHAGFHFCGAQKAEGRPYCASHWQMSFVPKNRGGSPVPGHLRLQLVAPKKAA